MKREGDGVLLVVIAVLTPTISNCDEKEGDEEDVDDEEGDDDEETEDTFVLLLFSKTDETAGFLFRWEKMSPPLWGRRRGGCSSWNRFVLQKPPLVLGRC